MLEDTKKEDLCPPHNTWAIVILLQDCACVVVGLHIKEFLLVSFLDVFYDRCLIYEVKDVRGVD